MTEKQIYSLCEAVADLANNFAHAPQHPDDSREMCRLCIEWAEAFEKKYAGHEWGVDEGPDYIDAIDKWFDEMYQAWVASADGTRVNDMTVPSELIPKPIA